MRIIGRHGPCTYLIDRCDGTAQVADTQQGRRWPPVPKDLILGLVAWQEYEGPQALLNDLFKLSTGPLARPAGEPPVPIRNFEESVYSLHGPILQDVLKELRKQRTPIELVRAAQLLYRRIYDGAYSLYLLRHEVPDALIIDGPNILRSAYDAMLQLLYILCGGSQCNERAKLYLDFLWIEKHHLRRIIDTSKHDLAKAVSTSPDRTEGEDKLNRQLLHVGPRYLTQKGQKEWARRGNAYLVDAKAKYRPKWYPGKLSKIAEEVGFQSEYVLFQKHMSAYVHSSVLALAFGPLMKLQTIVFLGLTFGLRSAGAVVKAFGIQVPERYRQKMAVAQRSFYDRPN